MTNPPWNFTYARLVHGAGRDRYLRSRYLYPSLPIITSSKGVSGWPRALADKWSSTLVSLRTCVLEHFVIQILSPVLVIVIGNYPRVVHLISTARGRMQFNLEDAPMKGAREVFIEQERA